MGENGRLVGGRYRVDRELFRGPGALTLLVTDLRNGRPCVLRRLTAAAASPAAARRFESQAAILARLDHPGLPRFVDGFSEGEGAAMVRVVVTSYHPGESLERLVAKGRVLSEPQALQLLRRLVSVLVYLHSFEPPLVHRTISAAGIIIGPDGRPCLTDLDYAGAEQATPSPGQRPPGPDDLALAAPEVFMDGAIPASDIYALGLVICRGMTGGDPVLLLREGAKAQLREALGASEAFAAVLARMLEASAERRYADVKALDADLARLAGVKVPPPPPPPPPPARSVEEPRPPRRARSALLALVALALVALAAFAVRVRNQPAPAPSLLVVPPAQEQATVPPPGVSTEAPVPALLPVPVPEPAALGTAAPAAESAPTEPPAAPTPTTSSLPASPPVAAAAVVAAGRLLLDGQPFTNPAAPAPRFWFREEGQKTVVKPEVEFAAGAFSLRGLPPGRYAMSARIDLEPGNPSLYPGDLTAWAEFTLEAGKTAEIEVPLRTVLHLVQPVDNAHPIPGWDVPCGAGNVLPGNLLFSWDALGRQTRYTLSVDRLSCDGGDAPARRVVNQSTSEAWLKLELPPNQQGECYSARLSASRDGRTVGIMTTHGATGLGWDFRFTVAK